MICLPIGVRREASQDAWEKSAGRPNAKTRTPDGGTDLGPASLVGKGAGRSVRLALMVFPPLAGFLNPFPPLG